MACKRNYAKGISMCTNVIYRDNHITLYNSDCRDMREILLPLAIVCILKITREEILKSDLESGVKENFLQLLGINTNKE